MKQNTFTKLLVAGAACTIALSTALAQTSSTTVTTGDTGTTTGTSVSTGTTSSVAASTSSMDATGTITAFTPSSNVMMVRSQSSAEPVQYQFTKQTTVVDPEGNTAELSMLRPDMPVHYTYVKEGDRMVVTKVTLEKPISYYKKTETTTTTTNP